MRRKLSQERIGRCGTGGKREQREELQTCGVIGKDWYAQQTRSKCQRESREQETSYVSLEETFMSLSGAYSPSHENRIFIAVVFTFVHTLY